MVWLGIGVILIGIALLVIAIVLIKPLMNLASVLKNVEKITKTLTEDVQVITAPTKTVNDRNVNTLNEVNNQVKELSSIFYIIGDTGRAASQVRSNLLTAVGHMKEKIAESNDFARENV